jgi:hypothetical protein
MQITTIGLDIAKNVFQVHGIDAKERWFGLVSASGSGTFATARSRMVSPTDSIVAYFNSTFSSRRLCNNIGPFETSTDVRYPAPFGGMSGRDADIAKTT